MLFAQADQFFYKGQYVGIALCQRPIEPAYLVVLAVGVVVSPLCPQYLISGS